MQECNPEDSAKTSRDLISAIASRRLDAVYKQAGANDFVMVRVRAPSCRWKSESLGALAEIASTSADGSLHFTTRGDVELHGVKFSVLDRVLDGIRLAGLTGRGGCGDSVRNVVACAGSGVCPEEKYDAAALARKIAEEFTGVAAFENLPRKFKISVSGCERACACPQIQDIGIVARAVSAENGMPQFFFDIFLAGGLGRSPMLAKRVKQLAEPGSILPFVRATVECFNELGDRSRRQQARMKFLAQKLGHEELLRRIMERMGATT